MSWLSNIGPGINLANITCEFLRLLEINTGLIVGCMPILPGLFKHERGFKRLRTYATSLRSHLVRSEHAKDSASTSRLKSKPSRLTASRDGKSFRSTPKQSVELVDMPDVSYMPNIDYSPDITYKASAVH